MEENEKQDLITPPPVLTVQVEAAGNVSSLHDDKGTVSMDTCCGFHFLKFDAMLDLGGVFSYCGPLVL